MHVSHVGESHRSAIVVGNDQPAVLIGGKDLIVCAQRPGIYRTCDFSLGPIGIGRGQGCANRIQTDAQLVQQGWIEFRAHRRLSAAAYEYLADPFDLRQLLRQNRVRGVVHAWQGEDVRSESYDQNRRIRRIHFPIIRITRQIGRELAASSVDGGLHVAPRGIDVATEVELQHDVGRSQLTRRGHLVDAGDSSELALQRRRDSRSHGLGTRSR